MPIELTCTGCQKTLRVSAAAAGKRARCPNCGQINHVPVTGGFAASGESSGGSSWSTGDWAPNEPVAETGNPFSSPYGYAPREPVTSSYIHSKVAGPAIALIVVSGINLLWVMLQFVGVFADMAMPGLQPNRNIPGANVAVVMGLSLGIILLFLLKDIFVIYGAIQMKNTQSYSMAMTATILAMIPCGSPCCLFSFPLAIWALVVLVDAEVKDAFRSAGAN